MNKLGVLSSLEEVVPVGVGSLVATCVLLMLFLTFLCLLPPIPSHKPNRLTPKLSPMKRDSIVYPDDEYHLYADMRAWDRHLVFMGMLPIYTSDPDKVGPILRTTRIKDSDIGSSKIIGDWIVTEYRGIKTLSEADVQKDTDDQTGRTAK